MSKCNFCKKNTMLPFVCNYCGFSFCPEHRLPEAHDCVGVPKKKFWDQKQRQQMQSQEAKRTPHSSANFILSEDRKNRRKRVHPLTIALVSIIVVLVIGTVFLLFLVTRPYQ